MARRVFVSFLGTNNYLETIYQFSDGAKSEPTRFVQEAIMRKVCGEWNEQDRVYIFCTKEAQKKNWFDGGQSNAVTQIERTGLKTRMESSPILAKLLRGDTMVPIPDGFSEKEVWNIFDIVYKKLQDGDVVFFDVTHAFRAIPLFSTVLFNYSRLMKNVQLSSIQYGAFEKLGPAFEVRNIPVEERVAPVLDLTNSVMLQQYADMAASLTQFGRINQIGETLSEYSDKNEFVEQMRKGIETFDEYLVANQMSKIYEGKWLINILNAFKQVNKTDIPLPIKETLIKLRTELNPFTPSASYQNIEAAIDWARRFNMLPNAYTLAREYIVTRLVDRYREKNPFLNLKKSEVKIKYREYISAICGLKDEDRVNKNYKGDLLDYGSLTDEFLADPIILEVRKYYGQLGYYRNIINHAKPTELAKGELIRTFDSLYYPCLKVIKENDSVDQPLCTGHNVLLNFSNHPSSDWMEEQIEAASIYGRIEDLPFPNISPSGDECSLSHLVDEYVDKITEMCCDGTLTVHIMGEMNFTYAMVNRLRAEGVTCVASTTERVVEELPNGEKKSTFRFVKFRRYE